VILGATSPRVVRRTPGSITTGISFIETSATSTVQSIWRHGVWVPAFEVVKYISDLILRSLRSKRLEGWMQSADSRPSFETRAKARSSSDNGEAVTRG